MYDKYDVWELDPDGVREPQMLTQGMGREKGYTFKLDNARALITAYLVKLMGTISDIHDVHKVEILRAALLLPCDAVGMAVTDGKTVGVCKYAMRNA